MVDALTLARMRLDSRRVRDDHLLTRDALSTCERFPRRMPVTDLRMVQPMAVRAHDLPCLQMFEELCFRCEPDDSRRRILPTRLPLRMMEIVDDTRECPSTTRAPVAECFEHDAP